MESHIVFPGLLFHLLEKPVFVGLDKLEVAAGVIDNCLISLIGNTSMFDYPCLPFFFPSTHLCLIVIVNTVHDP